MMENNGGRARRRPESVSRGGTSPNGSSGQAGRSGVSSRPIQNNGGVTEAHSASPRTTGRTVQNPAAPPPKNTEAMRRPMASVPKNEGAGQRSHVHAPENRRPSRRQDSPPRDSYRVRTKETQKDAEKTSSMTVGAKRRSRYTAAPKNQALVEMKREERQLKAAESERKWQEGIVRVRGGVDKVMLAIILILVCLGSLMVFSASYPVAIAEGKDSLYYVVRQIRFVAIGGALMFIASIFPYKWYKKWGPFAAYGVSVLLLIAVLFIGKSEGEAKRWIGFGSFTIQPSELMKISLVLILAWYIEKFKKQIDARLNRLHTIRYNVIGPGVFVGIACVLILAERHLSGTIITGMVALAVMFVGGCHFGWTLSIFGTCALAIGIPFLLLNPYALKRITTFTDENADKLDELYQTTQGIYAIGSGGLLGLGFGQSRQKYSYVSAAHTDFIFSIWCEETGFVGGVLLIALFLAFVWRGYVIASRAPDTFSMLTAFGITTHVGLQAFLNMCVASDVIPNTGISLPFFSYGGSSLVVLMAEMGLLLSISRQYYRKESDLGREKILERQ